MSREKLNIPKKIHVGFQNRDGTYTGKLAYITYTDEKGVHRKEKSWNTWRDHGIATKNLDNEPTSGFVLNKKVGDYSSRWGGRRAWIRIYDPRDFEFEISVANLLFILEECSAIKGKGLEGEFVYSWDGTELVLLPVDSQEYQASSRFTSLQTKKVTKKDMKEGCLYINKDNEKVMYLGRHDWYEKTYCYRDGCRYQIKHDKLHVFVSVDGKSKYWTQKGFTKLAQKLGDDPSPLFAGEFEKFKKSIYGVAPAKIVGTPTATTLKESNWRNTQSAYIKKEDKFYPVTIGFDYSYPETPYWRYRTWEERNKVREEGKRKFYFKQVSPLPVVIDNEGYIRMEHQHNQDYRRAEVSKEELDKTKLYSIFVENEQGTKIAL